MIYNWYILLSTPRVQEAILISMDFDCKRKENVAKHFVRNFAHFASTQPRLLRMYATHHPKETPKDNTSRKAWVDAALINSKD